MQDPANYPDPQTFNPFRFVADKDDSPRSEARFSHPSRSFPFWGAVGRAWSVYTSPSPSALESAMPATAWSLMLLAPQALMCVSHQSRPVLRVDDGEDDNDPSPGPLRLQVGRRQRAPDLLVGLDHSAAPSYGAPHSQKGSGRRVDR